MTPVLQLLAAIVLVTYSNVIVKSRVGALGGVDQSVSSVNLLLRLIADQLIWTAAVATVLGMGLYVLSLRHLSLSVAQPALALVFVAVPLAAALFLGENLSALRLAGLFVIALGVLIVFLSA